MGDTTWEFDHAKLWFQLFLLSVGAFQLSSEGLLFWENGRVCLLCSFQLAVLIIEKTFFFCFLQASSDGIIKVWDQSSMVLLHVIRAFPDQNAGVSCMDVSLDNRMLASGGQEALKFWSLKDGALLFALRTLPSKAVNVSFSLATAVTHRSLLVSCSDGSFWSLPFRWDEMASSPAIFSDLQRLAVGPGDEPSRNERPPIAQSPSEMAREIEVTVCFSEFQAWSF